MAGRPERPRRRRVEPRELLRRGVVFEEEELVNAMGDREECIKAARGFIAGLVMSAAITIMAIVMYPLMVPMHKHLTSNTAMAAAATVFPLSTLVALSIFCWDSSETITRCRIGSVSDEVNTLATLWRTVIIIILGELVLAAAAALLPVLAGVVVVVNIFATGMSWVALAVAADEAAEMLSKLSSTPPQEGHESPSDRPREGALRGAGSSRSPGLGGGSPYCSA